jgi:hypothetical protein
VGEEKPRLSERQELSNGADLMDWPVVGVWTFVIFGCLFFWYVILNFVGVI